MSLAFGVALGLNAEVGGGFAGKRLLCTTSKPVAKMLKHVRTHRQRQTPASVIICRLRWMVAESCLVAVVQANSVVQVHMRKYDTL